MKTGKCLTINNQVIAKRKYESYDVATEFGEETFFDYHEALSYYGRSESATLYGVDEYGDVSVILSK